MSKPTIRSRTAVARAPFRRTGQPSRRFASEAGIDVAAVVAVIPRADEVRTVRSTGSADSATVVEVQR